MSAALRWLRVQHETVYEYDAPVELAHHVAYLSPRATDRQIVRGWSLSIDPTPDEWLPPEPDRLRRALRQQDQPSPAPDQAMWLSLTPESQFSVDCFGNRRLAFSHSRVHEQLRVVSIFEAGLASLSLPHPDLSPPWETVAEGLRYHAGAMHSEAVEYTLPSPFVPRSASLAELGRQAFTPGCSLLQGALVLMGLVHERFEYKPQATTVNTRATEALRLSSGVCQDFAHVMIGACRSLGLAARYVSGYLLTQPPPGQPRLVGADASHAWVSVWCPELGWLALDPTNNVPIGPDHVTLAWGRDYGDVAPLRGVIRGGGHAQPRVAVTVEPLESEPERAEAPVQSVPLAGSSLTVVGEDLASTDRAQITKLA